MDPFLLAQGKTYIALPEFFLAGLFRSSYGMVSSLGFGEGGTVKTGFM